ncbi:MAG: hypothetical protein ACE5GJ_14705 [Gemmatimonadota bacterium]
MQSEHLSNLHPGWIVGGWLIALAVTSGVYLAQVGAGLLPSENAVAVGVAVAMAVGFFAGGFFVGWRWSDAPILHAAAMTFLSVLVWFLGSLTAPGSFTLGELGQPWVLGMLLLQFAAAIVGGQVGRRLVG